MDIFLSVSSPQGAIIYFRVPRNFQTTRAPNTLANWKLHPQATKLARLALWSVLHPFRSLYPNRRINLSNPSRAESASSNHTSDNQELISFKTPAFGRDTAWTDTNQYITQRTAECLRGVVDRVSEEDSRQKPVVTCESARYFEIEPLFTFMVARSMGRELACVCHHRKPRSAVRNPCRCPDTRNDKLDTVLPRYWWWSCRANFSANICTRTLFTRQASFDRVVVYWTPQVEHSLMSVYNLGQIQVCRHSAITLMKPFYISGHTFVLTGVTGRADPSIHPSIGRWRKRFWRNKSLD